ncbi:translation initiation factor IF-2-like [Canis lupus familiaris]|uniref:translation initiation factor IF-2-like n=1 Tax=Canis lupus familiaris TaxID=9615 RepID=UPI0018F7C136|nr:translation initiation factor IF-2-like [Canis lupus familiaris]XP_038302144.1 translation initiation factor IF-2-like [Canis lupus familiaris]
MKVRGNATLNRQQEGRGLGGCCGQMGKLSLAGGRGSRGGRSRNRRQVSGARASFPCNAPRPDAAAAGSGLQGPGRTARPGGGPQPVPDPIPGTSLSPSPSHPHPVPVPGPSPPRPQPCPIPIPTPALHWGPGPKLGAAMGAPRAGDRRPCVGPQRLDTFESVNHHHHHHHHHHHQNRDTGTGEARQVQADPGASDSTARLPETRNLSPWAPAATGQALRARSP